jgi:hypothetical protein
MANIGGEVANWLYQIINLSLPTSLFELRRFTRSFSIATSHFLPLFVIICRTVDRCKP